MLQWTGNTVVVLQQEAGTAWICKGVDTYDWSWIAACDFGYDGCKAEIRIAAGQERTEGNENGYPGNKGGCPELEDRRADYAGGCREHEGRHSCIADGCWGHEGRDPGPADGC